MVEGGVLVKWALFLCEAIVFLFSCHFCHWKDLWVSKRGTEPYTQNICIILGIQIKCYKTYVIVESWNKIKVFKAYTFIFRNWETKNMYSQTCWNLISMFFIAIYRFRWIRWIAISERVNFIYKSSYSPWPTWLKAVNH